MPELLTYDELQERIGSELGTSDWFTIDQNRINLFADATLDHQWIHVDVEKAVSGPFGAPIAHGFLVLSMLPHLSGQSMTVIPKGLKAAINYGLDRLRFITPVKVNSEIRNRAILKDVSMKGNNILVNVENTIEIKDEEKPACIAEALTLFFM